MLFLAVHSKIYRENCNCAHERLPIGLTNRRDSLHELVVCATKFTAFHFSAYYNLVTRSEVKDHLFTLQVRIFFCQFLTLDEQGGDATPIRFFWIFFLEDKTSAPDVFSRCSFIPRAHFEISWVMVSCYGYEMWRHKSHFWVKVHVFSTFLTIKVIYLCVIFPVKRKRLPFLTVLTWFIVIVKMQDGGQDGDHCWWRHRPPATPPPIKYTSFC